MSARSAGAVRARRRSSGIGLAASLVFHLAFVLMFVRDFTAPYALPSPSEPSPETEVTTSVELERPISPPPAIPEPRPIARPAPAPASKSAPAPPPTQVRMAPSKAISAASRIELAPASRGATASFAPVPQLQAPVAPAAPAKPAATAKAAAPAPLASLNLHKPARKAPAGVPTLPAAPKGGAPAQAGTSAAPGSRLSGLTPWPAGVLPNGGGGGLRGSLIGCANAQAVGLTAAERTRCEERFGEEMGDAPRLDSIAPARRAEFDKAAAKQELGRREGDGRPLPLGTARPVGAGPESAIPHPPDMPDHP